MLINLITVKPHLSLYLFMYVLILLVLVVVYAHIFVIISHKFVKEFKSIQNKRLKEIFI